MPVAYNTAACQAHSAKALFFLKGPLKKRVAQCGLRTTYQRAIGGQAKRYEEQPEAKNDQHGDSRERKNGPHVPRLPPPRFLDRDAAPKDVRPDHRPAAEHHYFVRERKRPLNTEPHIDGPKDLSPQKRPNGLRDEPVQNPPHKPKAADNVRAEPGPEDEQNVELHNTPDRRRESNGPHDYLPHELPPALTFQLHSSYLLDGVGCLWRCTLYIFITN